MDDITQTPRERPLSWAALIETVLLAVTATLLLAKVSRGVIAYYIHPRYTPLVVASGLVLLGIALVRTRQIFSDHPEPLAGRARIYALLLVPLAFGTLVPAQPLGADALMSRSLDPRGAASARWAGRDVSGDTTGWDLLDWASVLSTGAREAYGAPVLVEGFVTRPEQLDGADFYVARYVVTCCAADGAGVGLAVVWPDGPPVAAGGWVRIEGTLEERSVNGGALPAIVARAVTPIAQPDPPYLYP